MSYQYITNYNSQNYTAGRQGNKISEIVIHHWGVDGQSFSAVVNWLCRANGTSSAHYVVEAGKVACLVDCSNTAWHAGNFPHNLKSIGIECRPEMSAGDLETVCELVADIYKVYGVLPIIGHKDVSSTACPGRYYAKLAYIKDRAIQIMNGSKPVKPTKPLPDALKKFSDLNGDDWFIKELETVVKNGWMSGYENGKFGPYDSMTRGQAVCIISRMANAKFDHPYSDVVASPYYYDAVEWATEQGIITGSNGKFRPNDACTRGEFVLMLFRWQKGKASKPATEFKDWNSIPDYLKDAVSWAKEKGILKTEYANVNKACTRAETAVILVRVDELM